MVSDCVPQQSLQVLFAEDLLVMLVFVWEVFLLLIFFFDYLWDNNCSADVISVLVGLPRRVLGSWYEDSFLHIGCSKDDGELGVVYPSLLPIDFWLGTRKSGVPEDCFLFSQVREEEPHGGCRGSGASWEVCVVL